MNLFTVQAASNYALKQRGRGIEAPASVFMKSNPIQIVLLLFRIPGPLRSPNWGKTGLAPSSTWELRPANPPCRWELPTRRSCLWLD